MELSVRWEYIFNFILDGQSHVPISLNSARIFFLLVFVPIVAKGTCFHDQHWFLHPCKEQDDGQPFHSNHELS